MYSCLVPALRSLIMLTSEVDFCSLVTKSQKGRLDREGIGREGRLKTQQIDGTDAVCVADDDWKQVVAQRHVYLPAVV